MSEFTLPSGRALQLKDQVSYGDVCDAEDESARLARDGKASVNAFSLTLMAAMSGLPLSEVRELSKEDGRALYEEVTRLYQLREPSDEAPFVKSSPRTSGTRARK